MKNKVLLLLFVFFTLLGYSQTYTSIPDPNFENALDNLGYDDMPNDGQVPTANIETILDLDVSNQNISDLTGIEDFRDLQMLIINDNSIINLDLSGISNLTMLEARNCGLGSIDVFTHSNLNQLQLENNNFSTIDVSNNGNLTELWLQNNPIASIDLSNNAQLQTLAITNGNLTNIDVTNNTLLSQVFLSENVLTELDFSNQNNLMTLDVQNNNLTILNIKNGNNTNITNLNFDGNPDLVCILVDDVSFAEANFANGNPFSYFTETSCYTAILDANFETALSSYDDIPNDGQVPTGLIFQITDLNVTNASIQDLTGIEAFTALMNLTVDNNPIQQLDLTNNTFLQNVEVQNCNLQTIDISGLTDLMQLNLANNALTSLDLSTFTQLNIIDLSGNDLNSLNLKNGNNGAIGQLDVRSNPNLFCVLVSDINLPNNPNILYDSQTGFTTETYCRYTAIPDANFESILNTLGYDDTPSDGQVPTALIEDVTNLDIRNASITDLSGIADFSSLIELQISGNNISTVDLSNNAQLQILRAIDCGIQTLNLMGLTNLYQLSLQLNALTSLDLSTNIAVSSMIISSNDLTYLNLQNGNNAVITLLDIRSNSNLECVLIDDLNVLTTATVYNDSQTDFTSTQYCDYTAIPDANFEAALDALGYDDIAADGQVPTELIENLTTLDIGTQNIADLTGIEDFVSLTELDISNNNLITVSLTTLTNLGILDVQSNIALTSLDLSGNTQLEQLVVEDCTSLTTLDLSANVILEDLIANQTSLSTINFGNITNLSNIDVDGANFTSLDVSSLPVLTRLDVSGNQLISLNIANGNNVNFINFDARSNTNLRCIAVDDPVYASANFTNIDAQTEFRQTSCYTAIPDANFEAALTALDYDDIPNDGQVPTYAIENVTSLDVRNLNIGSIVGIEDFTALEDLNIDDNNINTLDISNNTALKTLKAVDNGLTSLDISNNALIEDLRVEENNLTSIDLSNQPNLRILQIDRNNLNTIDVSANMQLTRFRISYNNLTTIDLSNNPSLGEISVHFNNLETLDIRSGGNTNVTSFRANNNPNLTCIFVDDGTYSTTNWVNIDAQTSFSETEYCRYTAIPDTNFENALNFFGYDDIASDGQVPTELIEGVTSLTMINNGIADLTGIEDFVALEELNVDGNFLSTLDLSSNTNLIKVACQANGINTVNLTGLTALQEFNAPFNSYTTLDVSTNINLIKLHCNNTGLTTLDVSNLNVLTDLDCSANFLTALNVRNGNNTNFTNFNATNNPDLTCIFVDDAAFAGTNFTNVDNTASFTSTDYCRYTQIPDVNFEAALEGLGYDDIAGDGQVPTALIEVITDLDVRNSGISSLVGIEDFTALQNLNINNNSVNQVDFSNNTQLVSFRADLNGLTSLDLSNNPLVEDLRLARNLFTTIDLSNQPNLTNLQIDNNNLTSIDLSINTLLSRCRISANNLTSVDLSNNPLLTEIRIQNCNLSYLNVQSGGNTNVTDFRVNGNANLTCILVDDVAYSSANWTTIDAQANFVETSYCDYTTIPDANFEAALEALGYDDISADGQVPTELIENVTTLIVENANISDLTGIEDFTMLEVLNIRNNNVTTIDLSNNTLLTNLNAVSNNLTALDITNNPLINDLRVEVNAIATIDLSNQLDLKILQINNNQLTALDVSNNPLIERFRANNNMITALDLSNNTSLLEVLVQNNQLETLNIQNGANTNITKFTATGNANLTCILVDDAVYSTTNWTSIDVTASFSDTSCTVDFNLAIKVYLQGAALNPNTGEETLMRDDLRMAGYIPTRSPYTDMLECDTAIFTTTGTEAIVDWVWVELRDQSDNTQVVYSQSALLQRDGDVVDVDGTSPLTFNTTEDTYSVAVRHRNHLGIITASAITFTADAVYGIDFTNNSITTFGSNAQTTSGLPSGISGMWCGNVNDDMVVQYSGTDPDTPDLLSTVLNDLGNFLNFPTYSITEYNINDVNMDGIIQYSGTNPDTPFILQNVLAHPGNFLNFSTYQIIEQLPENVITTNE